MSKLSEQELLELVDLLPWYLNGTLDDAERHRVRAALSESQALRDALGETVQAADFATGTPSTSTLVAHAVGELESSEREAVDEYLASAPDEAELVAMARDALGSKEVAAAAHPGTLRFPIRGQPASGSLRWALVAAASLLFAVVAGIGWWSTIRSPKARLAAVASVSWIELLPDDLTLRGETEPSPLDVDGSIDDADAEVPIAVLLVTSMVGNAAAKGEGDLLELSLRNDADQEIARLTNLAPRPDGSISILLEPSQLPGLHSLVLLKRESSAVPGSERVVHRYRFP